VKERHAQEDTKSVTHKMTEEHAHKHTHTHTKIQTQKEREREREREKERKRVGRKGEQTRRHRHNACGR
jgi:hypothetical protein